MKLPYSRVQVKHLSIPQNQTSYAFDNVFTGALPDLVVYWTRGRRGFCRWVPEKPVQFSEVWRQPHRAQAQWTSRASRELHSKLDDWRLYKRLPFISGSTWIRQWRQVR